MPEDHLMPQESPEARFLQFLRRVENAAVLLKRANDGNLSLVFASGEYLRMMEYGAGDVGRLLTDDRSILATTHSDDRLAVKRMLRRRISEDGTKDLTIRKITAKGNTLWVNVHYTFIDDFAEHYVYCTYFDVTTSRVYADRLRATYTSIGDSFYRESDRTLGMFRVNLPRDRMEDMQGKDLFGTDSLLRPYSEVMRLRAGNYPIAEEREKFLHTFGSRNLMKSYLEGKSQASLFLFSRRRDGKLCYVNYTAMMTRHPISGEIIAFISELEASKEKVESSLLEKILARQFDMVAYVAGGKYGVVVGDASLIEKGSIFPLSRSGDYAEYLRDQIVPVLSGDDEAKSVAAKNLSLDTIREKVRQKEPYIVNIACDIDGETYHKRLDFYGTHRDADFFILLKSDTTEVQRKQIEQNNQLKEALADAKQASVAKTAFLSRMSHEIRTPMNAIIGLDNIALHEEGLSEKMRDHLEKIGSSARYLLSLINDILDMSRIESGRMTLRSEEFSFREFLDQIYLIAESQCRDRGLNFHPVVHGQVGEYYIGDGTKLKQVLINILGNAVKFTEPGGDITLSVECTGRYDEHSSFRFIVRDTGIGMDAEFLPKIFEAFSQEDDTNTSSYGGSGLGMAITKNLVGMMNGTISVESEKGKGSAFTVTVPLRDSPRHDKREGVDIRPQELSVFIVDDDPVALAHAKSVLDEAGIGADTCGSCTDALDILRLRHARREAYNLILVDLRMPELDGIDMARHIREILGDDPTVIILTVFDWSDVEDEARKAGVDSFIAKPLVAADLIREVKNALSRRKSQAEPAKAADLTGRRILVAEDMMVNAEIMKQLLAMMGMEAEHAENGKIAVDMFTGHAPGYYDAVLMDVRMPVMDGLQAAEAIRAADHADARRIPIIAMTANAFDEDVQRSLQAGMNAHLAKPVEPENMYRTLQEMIGRQEATGST